MSAFCIPCQWSPPRHCGRCPCCREALRQAHPREQPGAGNATTKYRFYRIIYGEKIYLFCREAFTPQPFNAAVFTEADWLEWGQGEGLEREEVGAKL